MSQGCWKHFWTDGLRRAGNKPCPWALSPFTDADFPLFTAISVVCEFYHFSTSVSLSAICGTVSWHPLSMCHSTRDCADLAEDHTFLTLSNISTAMLLFLHVSFPHSHFHVCLNLLISDCLFFFSDTDSLQVVQAALVHTIKAHDKLKFKFFEPTSCKC